jgi:VIT1/CCC1 family predicted Fe2+/Mn2+ transporter
MKVFNQTILVCSLAAAFIILLFAFTNEGISSAGVLLFLGAPIVFIIGLITTLLSSKESPGRQVGQGIMLSALIYFVVGFTTCSVGGGIKI